MPADRNGKQSESFDAVVVQRRPTRARPDRIWRNWLIGRPLVTADAPHQTVGKAIGLAIFASDPLSSTAYATQEILHVLSLAGFAVLALAFPISIGIVILILIVALSYYQIIHAYPGGGGAYTVGRDNLGSTAAVVAAAALLVDYILTVSVSISSGVAQVVSAYPDLHPYRVWLAVLCILATMLINLRGVRESGALLAGPTFLFIGTFFVMVVVGLVRYASGRLGTVPDPPEVAFGTQAVTAFLILRAFAGGTVALTGTEAISNGVTAFRGPRAHNAGITLLWMAGILSTFLVTITFLAVKVGAVPSEMETVISQLARTIFGGRGPLYLLTVAVTTAILVLAANTAFAGFPRLGAIVAADGYLPRQLSFKGSRLVYSSGIVALAIIASLLVILFRGSVSALIPLYAVGVFLSFTISQAGMVVRWWRIGHPHKTQPPTAEALPLPYDPLWRVKAGMNLLGAFCTATVTIMFGVTKFRDGAWIVVLLIPALILIFFAIRKHYAYLAKRLSLEHFGAPPRISRHRVILPIGGVHRGTLHALRYALSLSDDVTAVHIDIDPAKTEEVRQKWASWGSGVRLVILESPYRLLIEPLLEYIEDILRKRQPNEVLTVVVPHFVSSQNWTNLLHSQTAGVLRQALLHEPGIVITEVPYQIDTPEGAEKELLRGASGGSKQR
ncbi:MAG: APC family permease [bacterium JZ-2024 1]